MAVDYNTNTSTDMSANIIIDKKSLLLDDAKVIKPQHSKVSLRSTAKIETEPD